MKTELRYEKIFIDIYLEMWISHMEILMDIFIWAIN